MVRDTYRAAEWVRVEGSRMGWGRGQQHGWGYRAAEWLGIRTGKQNGLGYRTAEWVGVEGSRMGWGRGQQNGLG